MSTKFHVLGGTLFHNPVPDQFLRGGGDRDVEALYERVAMGWKAHECYVSAEAFQAFADLAGLTPREIVRRLPAPGLNKVAARARA